MRLIDIFETTQSIGCAGSIPECWKILVPIDAIYYELDDTLRSCSLGVRGRDDWRFYEAYP